MGEVSPLCAEEKRCIYKIGRIDGYYCLILRAKTTQDRRPRYPSGKCAFYKRSEESKSGVYEDE